MPETGQTSAVTTAAGRGGAVGSPKRAAIALYAAGTSGVAPSVDITRCVGEPSKLPAHTPTVYSRVVPIAHRSVYALVVPVLSATGNGRFSGTRSPNIGLRASGSARMSYTRYAISSENTRSRTIVVRSAVR